MEEFYSMRELLKFLQRQHHDGYVVIEAIVNLIEYKSENLTEENKPSIIIETLRKYGLYEVGFEGEKTFNEEVSNVNLSEEKEKPDVKFNWYEMTSMVQIEQYNIQLLNGYIAFESFLN